MTDADWVAICRLKAARILAGEYVGQGPDCETFNAADVTRLLREIDRLAARLEAGRKFHEELP